MRPVLIFIIAVCICASAASQTAGNENKLKKGRLALVAAGGGLLYAGTLAGLYNIWYKDYERTDFHWFDDNDGWMQIDKFGHAYTAYIFGKTGYKGLAWTGLNRKASILIGGSYGFLFLSSVELLDAHYKAWGASPGDIACNAAGAAVFIGQELWAKSQVMTMKFSYNPSPLAEYRPELLGEGSFERIIKDYNGQTYWFSFNYRSFFRRHEIIPEWMNVAGGYSAYGMLGGYSNPEYLPEVERYRRYLVSLDIDFDRVKTKSKFLKSVLFFANMLKLPFPTIEFNEKGEFIFHPIYF